jgi:hypothetical protein
LHEFLRRRLVAATIVAALLRHRATNSALPCFEGIVLLAVALCHAFHDRLAGFAGRGFIANINVAIAHDCYPLL